MNIKKMTASLCLVTLAVLTGYSVGKMYVDSNTVEDAVVNATEEDLREDESVISALVDDALSGADVMSFNAIELFQIAENNLANSTSFMKEMTGKTVSLNLVSLDIKSQKIKMNDSIVYYKLCPATSSMTPNIATRTVYKNSSPNAISVTNADTTCFTNKDSEESLDALFDGHVLSQTTYTSDEYLEAYKTTPDSSLLSYIISTNTCDESNCSEVVDNGDGTYTFSFVFTGNDECKLPALYYSYEIKSTCGYDNPSLQWQSIEMTVTIDENFNFVSIEYDENYKLSASNLPFGMKSATVNDLFSEKFYYDASVIEQKAISDYWEVA